MNKKFEEKRIEHGMIQEKTSNDITDNRKYNYINKDIVIDFELSKTMQDLVNKAEKADLLEDYGLYMNLAYAIEEKEMTYLYNDGDIYYFMDPQTYEQFPYGKQLVQDALPYMVENTNVIVKFFKGEVFSVSPQLFVFLTVTKTEPGLQGDTTKATFKPATLETGLEIQIPLFINEGERIKVDTRTGEYVERA